MGERGEDRTQGSASSRRSAARRRVDPHAASPDTHLLSNGRYSVMLTAAGSGYSRWRDLAVTRWREDATCDDWGSYIYLRDVESDRLWSATYQPTSAGRINIESRSARSGPTFSRQDGDLTYDARSGRLDRGRRRGASSHHYQQRQARLARSRSPPMPRSPSRPRRTTAPTRPSPSCSSRPNIAARFGAILATRRRRSPDELGGLGRASLGRRRAKAWERREFETDRARFLGRGLGVRTPASAIDGRLLSRSTGAVLDPVFALRRRVRLEPGAAARIDFWTLVAESREKLLDVVDKTNDISAFDRAATLAWTQAQVQLHHLGIDRGRGEPVPASRRTSHLCRARRCGRPRK